MVEIIALVVSVAVSAAIGFFVYARNPRSIINLLYAVLTLALILFALANYLSLQTTNRLFYIRAVIFFSTVIVATLYYLVSLLGSRTKKLNKIQGFGIALTVVVLILEPTPLIFSGISGGDNPVPVPNFAAPFFIAHLFVFLSASFILLIKKIKASRGMQRLQYSYLLIGITPVFAFAPITGFIMPVVFKNASLIVLSPLYTTFFVCLVGYAIVRHRLFDINFFVIRSVAYLTSLFMLSLFCVAPMVLLFFHFFHKNASTATVLLVIGISVAATYLLQYIRDLFDKLTSKLFYRYYYDPQDVLDKLSDVVVHTVDAEGLRSKSASVLRDSLKPSFVEFALASDGENSLAPLADKIAKYTKSNLISVDDNRLSSQLSDLLRESGVALAVKLRTKHENLGYIVLGYRESGEVYSERDRRLVSTAADEIAISLQNALRFEQIQRFNETLQEKVADATRRLSETNRKLRMMDETKDDFIGMASHQLRTPLTSVKGYLSLVLDGDAGKITSQQRKLLTQAFISSQRMVFLIADLLNVSRLKTGKFVIETAPVNLSDMITDEINQLQETATARELTLDFHKPAHFPTIDLDETKTRQVVMNFLDNAVYYTPSGGHIEVSLTETPKSIELHVKDNGIGVPKAEQHHLFSKFYRAKNAQKARPDGTGLGLFMAKKVVIAQGGAIIFESKEGEGSTFGFIFPKKPVPQSVPVTAK